MRQDARRSKAPMASMGPRRRIQATKGLEYQGEGVGVGSIAPRGFPRAHSENLCVLFYQPRFIDIEAASYYFYNLCGSLNVMVVLP